MTEADRPKIPVEFYEYVGRVASEWSVLELSINRTLWALAWTDAPAGACLTAQIFSADSRMKALTALLTIRGAEKRLIDRVNKLSDRMRQSLDLRNRIIHDPWSIQDAEKPIQLSITANRKLRFELVVRDIEQLRREFETISALVKEFEKLAAEIEDWQTALQKERMRKLLNDFIQNRISGSTLSDQKTGDTTDPK
jgi:hypothetical protein